MSIVEPVLLAPKASRSFILHGPRREQPVWYVGAIKGVPVNNNFVRGECSLLEPFTTFVFLMAPGTLHPGNAQALSAMAIAIRSQEPCVASIED